MPSARAISSAWSIRPVRRRNTSTSCSATTSGAAAAITSAMRPGEMRPSTPRQRWTFQVRRRMAGTRTFVSEEANSWSASGAVSGALATTPRIRGLFNNKQALFRREAQELAEPGGCGPPRSRTRQAKGPPMQNVPKPPDPAPDQTPPPQPELPVTPPDVYPGLPINDPGAPAPIGIPPITPPSVPPGPEGPEIPATL